MRITHRSYHLHASKSLWRRGVLRWSVTRTVWGPGTAGLSSVCGAGQLEMTIEGGTAPEQALAVLRAALVAYEAELRGSAD